MSKEAKERQGYEAKPLARVCSTCANFGFDMDWPAWIRDGGEMYASHRVEGNKQQCHLRCNLGNFAVKKTATCKEWRKGE